MGMEPRELAGHMASGAIAGAAVEAALYPLDTIKTRMQVAQGGAPLNWRHLYKGLGGNLLGVMPACALFFAVYEPAKRHLLPADGSSSVGAHLAAAASGGLASSLIRIPTEVIKTRVQTGQFSTARGALWHIAAREGVFAGLFAGAGSFLLRDLPFDAVEFASYEQMKLAWQSWSGGRELRKHEAAGFGAFAGVLTGAVTTPMDVVKTRLMTQGAPPPPSASAAATGVATTSGTGLKTGIGATGRLRYRGVADCVVRMVKEEGWGSLLKGLGPRVTWIGIGGGVFFFALEGAQSVLVPPKPKAESLNPKP